MAFHWAWKGFAIKPKEGNFHINDLFDEAHLNDKKCCGKPLSFPLNELSGVVHIVWGHFQKALCHCILCLDRNGILVMLYFTAVKIF